MELFIIKKVINNENIIEGIIQKLISKDPQFNLRAFIANLTSAHNYFVFTYVV